jgi:hypothetical protein
MASTRTDVHRPSATEFDPESYECVGCYDLQTPGQQGRSNTVDYLQRQGYRAADVHPLGQCSHCGAYLRYTALMAHKPTMTYVWIGEQCLGNRFSGLTKSEFAALRKAAALNAERIRKAVRITTLVIDHPALAEIVNEASASAYGGFMASVGYQLRRDGRLTDRQITTVERIIPEAIERAHAEALRIEERKAEAAQAAPAPAGRVTVTGEVVSTKWQNNDFGGSLKMLVVATAGYRVWVTVPDVLLDDRCQLAKGTMVRFDAKLAPKTEDPTFAFGSRPTKAQRIETPTF